MDSPGVTFEELTEDSIPPFALAVINLEDQTWLVLMPGVTDDKDVADELAHFEKIATEPIHVYLVKKGRYGSVIDDILGGEREC